MNKRGSKTCLKTYPPPNKPLNNNDIFGLYIKVCKRVGIGAGITREEFEANEFPFVEDEYIIKTIHALLAEGVLMLRD